MTQAESTLRFGSDTECSKVSPLLSASQYGITAEDFSSEGSLFMSLKSVFVLISTLILSFSAFAQEREQSMVMSSGLGSLYKYSVTFFSIGSLTSKQADALMYQDPTSYSAYNYLGLNYRLDGNTKVSIRVPFIGTFVGNNKYGDREDHEKLDLQDVFVAYSWNDLGYIGDIDLSGNVKWYFPTSKFAGSSAMVGKFKAELYAEYALSRFSSITYAIKPEIYWQNRTAYFDDQIPQYSDGSGQYVADPRKTTKKYSLEHYVEAVLDINRYLSAKPKAGFEEDWYNASNVEDIPESHVTSSKLAFGIEIRPISELNMTVGMENKAPLETRKDQPVGLFRPENLSYTLMINAALL
jgi:hypothetical protein